MDQSDFSSGSASTGANADPGKIKQDAAQLKDTAAAKASEKTNEYSQKATSAAHSTSSALRDAGETLRNDDEVPNWLASAFQQAAESIGNLADTVEGKEPREMMRDVDQFARQNPSAFLAGAAIAGFAAARVMKAGAKQSDVSLDDMNPASSGDNAAKRTGMASTDDRFAPTGSTATSRTAPNVVSGSSFSTHDLKGS